MNYSRRDALKQGAIGAAGLTLSADQLLAAAAAAKQRPLAASKPGKAKSVIQIWMWGGPSHLDTFDPKPEAGSDYCGPLDKPIETKVSGIRISQLLPLLAKQADKYSIIRSMTHRVNAHETASYIVQTGHHPDRLLRPSLGAIVNRFKGYDAGYKGLIPPYVVMTKAQGRFSEAGFLGPKYKPFSTGGDPGKDPFLVEGVVAKGITEKRQHARRDLLGKLDTLGQAIPNDPRFEQFDVCNQKAYEMILGDAGKLFDLTQEDDELRERYGRNTFGQSCLMARRLIEAGVPYITINYQGWDTHKQHFQIMGRKLPELDAGFATLLEDLSQRGLLDSTVVWWSGEFGRGPKVQWNPPWNGGRSHFGNCFSSVLAGGGFKGGQVIGASDKTGSEPAERPVYPHDVLGSICMQMGIDPDGPMPNPRGMDLKVMPDKVEGTGESKGRLTEII